MNSDNELLRRFAEDNAQDAFAALVGDKIHLVYASALRQVGGDCHLAQDVTQGVFIALACNAGALKRHPALTGWLFTTTRNIAQKTMRTQQRWKRRETEAGTMESILRSDAVDRQELGLVIDEAMHDLDEKDRVSLLLRFFESKSHAEVGAAVGLGENAARMRIERALERLRASLSRRGFTSTAATLAAALANQPVLALPAGLTAAVTGTAISTAGALAGAATSPAVSATIGFMTTTKLALGTAAVIAVFTAGAFVGRHGVNHTGEPAAAAAAPGGEENLATQNGERREQREAGTIRGDLLRRRQQHGPHATFVRLLR